MKNFYLFILLFISISLKAQHKFGIGIEGGLTSIKYKIKDPGNNLQTVPCISGLVGMNVRINTSKRFFYEFGLMIMEYTEGVKLKQEQGWGSSSGDQVIFVPIRWGYNWKLTEKLSLTPLVGATTAIKLTPDETMDFTTNWTMNSDQQLPAITAFGSKGVGKNIFLLGQAGLGLEYSILKKLEAHFGFNYYHGLYNHIEYHIEYKLNPNTTQNATMYGKGTFINYQLGIKYLFGEKL